jgi:cysteine desulfurase
MTASNVPAVATPRRGWVYLDHNATTPPWPEVAQAVCDTLLHDWANPSSVHAAGQDSRRVLADARQRVAHFLGCQSAELVFTSGANEANHMALLGAMQAREAAAPARRRLLMSAVEHPALLVTARQQQQRGVVVQWLPVDGQGRLDLDEAQRQLGPDVALISTMAANNETGVLLPLEDMTRLAQAAHAHGAWLHVDATQWVGKLPFSFAASGADLVSVSAHKLGGPKGVGALIVRKGVNLPALFSGSQERHRRGGTENLPGIVGFAVACDRTVATQAADMARVATLRDRLQWLLQTHLPRVQVLGHAAPRLPNTLCVRFGDLHADQVLARLEKHGVLASSGAACSAGRSDPSHVLLAMGLTPEQAQGGVRFSLGVGTLAGEIETAFAAVRDAVGPLLGAQAQLSRSMAALNATKSIAPTPAPRPHDAYPQLV